MKMCVSNLRELNLLEHSKASLDLYDVLSLPQTANFDLSSGDAPRIELRISRLLLQLN